MGAVRLVFRAESRGRWRAWLAIAILISIVGGVVLAAAAAGRRTDSAFPRFVRAHGFDAIVYAIRPEPSVATLPGVSSVTEVVSPFSAAPTCLCTHAINPSDLTVGFAPSKGRSPFRLIAGRLPDPSSTSQVLASFTLQRDDGVNLGTVIHMPFFAPSQLAAMVNANGAPPKPLGPTVSLRVVGIEASPSEFPSGTTPSYDLFATRAFERRVTPRTANAFEYLVDLRHGAADLPRFEARARALASAGVEGVESEVQQTAAVEASIRPQAIGWWILAALAALVGLAVVGQALARQTLVEAEDYPAMKALGADRRQLVTLGMARNLVLAVAGALGALVVATALSPLAPVGEARLAEASTGVSFDVLVLSLGALATVVIVLVLGSWPAVRAARATRPDEQQVASRPSAVVARLAAMGAPPSVLIGVRHAVQRKLAGASVPVGTALLGTVLAVAALCGTVVFGASLSHLTATPVLYGDAFQLNFTVPPGQPDAGLLRSLRHDRAVTGITRGVASEVSIDKVTVGGVAGTAIRGPLLFPTVEGHVPRGDGQIGLGATTMHQVGAHVGSLVNVTMSLPSGGTRTAPFRVVSQVSFPVLSGFVGLGSGALFTIPGYEAAVCPPSPGQRACFQAVEQSGNGGLLVRVVPGPLGRAAVTHYLNLYRSGVALPLTPTSLINFGEAVNFPLIFGAILAVFGAATLAHLLVVSVSRRRREIGLLKVLGFLNGQVVSAVSWQATTVALVGSVIGVPLGVVAGKATWRLFATHLGVVPVIVIPI